jgi:uncharacterized protein
MTDKKTIQFKDAHRISKVPKAFEIMAKPIGPVCNLDCTYCYYTEKKTLYPETINFKMQDSTLELFVKHYIQEQQSDIINFTWQGGEPCLLGIDYFKKAIAFQKKHASNKKISNSFQTNGTLLTNEWCKFFAQNNFLIGISIDGPKEIHDKYRNYSDGNPSFEIVMAGIKLLKKHGCEFNTLTVVNNISSEYPLKIYHFLKEIGSEFMQFIPLVEREATNPNTNLKLVSPFYQDETKLTEWSVKPLNYGKFLSTIYDDWVRNDIGKHYVQIFDVTLANWIGESPGLCVFSETCGLSAVIEHNGDVYSCDHFVYRENFLGNIQNHSLGQLINSEKQFKFGLDKRDSLPTYCKNCDYRFACHGECPKHRFIKTPNGEQGLNYLCAAYKHFFKHVTPTMNYMAKELIANRAPANIMNHLRNT